jgi:hypothetical protein
MARSAVHRPLIAHTDLLCPTEESAAHTHPVRRLARDCVPSPEGLMGRGRRSPRCRARLPHPGFPGYRVLPPADGLWPCSFRTKGTSPLRPAYLMGATATRPEHGAGDRRVAHVPETYSPKSCQEKLSEKWLEQRSGRGFGRYKKGEMGRKEPFRQSVRLRYRRLRGFSDSFRRVVLRS